MSGKDGYKKALRKAQMELVKLQKQVISDDLKILVILEGRDAAGKDGAVKRIIEHMSPRETRVVALGKPSDVEMRSWYFQRWVPHLPTGGEIVLFNRSWYSRAGVERVMGFCTDAECEAFLQAVPVFEQLLVSAGITMLKYYLDISKGEQKRRLKDRAEDPLTQWKISPIDASAQKHWKDYSRARDDMLARSHSAIAPWSIVHADDKPSARLGIIHDMLARIEYRGRDRTVAAPDRTVVAPYNVNEPKENGLAP